MSRAKVAARGNLLGFVDSDSEDGLGNTVTVSRPLTSTTNSRKKQPASTTMPPATKGTRGRQPANKVTKTTQQKTTTRRNSGRIAAAVEAVVAEESRDALAEKSVNAQPKTTGRGRKKAVGPQVEIEDTVMADADAPEEPAPKPKATRGRPKKAASGDDVKEVTKPARAPAGRKPAAKKATAAVPDVGDETEIPETQPQASHSNDIEDEEPSEELPDRPLSPLVQLNRQLPSSPLKRPQYSSSSESGGEAALRRRLGDMTQRFESLDQKYRDLKEVAVREGERNFDRLKKQTEEKSKAADQLIASLKAELASQKEEAKEATHLKKQLEASETQVNELQTRVSGLTASVAESKAEIKSLNMKLSAARSMDMSKVPGSAIKGGSMKGLIPQPSNLAAQLKEDLYADLTGLIVRSAKREGGEDVYDCIQTGRNGTLHFKLSVPSDASSDNFENAETLYTPHLNENRDRDLIDILPDFLVEPISFARKDTGKFYARVLKALNDPVVYE